MGQEVLIRIIEAESGDQLMTAEELDVEDAYSLLPLHNHGTVKRTPARGIISSPGSDPGGVCLQKFPRMPMSKPKA
jgi:hypothetical protein